MNDFEKAEAKGFKNLTSNEELAFLRNHNAKYNPNEIIKYSFKDGHWCMEFYNEDEDEDD